MKLRHLDLLCCTQCKGGVSVKSTNLATKEELINGIIQCSKCQIEYKVVDSIVNFLDLSCVSGVKKEELFQRNKLASNYSEKRCEEINEKLYQHHFLPRMKRNVQLFSKRLEGKVVIDIGVGWGWHWENIKNIDILAVDYSWDSLMIAKKLLKDNQNVTLICADSTQLPIKTKVADGIWTVQVLQHFPPDNLKMALSEIKRISKDKFEIYIGWLNFKNIIFYLKKILKKNILQEIYSDLHYIRYLQPNEVKEVLNSLEYKKMSIEFEELFFHPDIRFRPTSNLFFWLEKLFVKIPGVNKLLSRQLGIYLS